MFTLVYVWFTFEWIKGAWKFTDGLQLGREIFTVEWRVVVLHQRRAAAYFFALNEDLILLKCSI